jgi:hypothetical protein
VSIPMAATEDATTFYYLHVQTNSGRDWVVRLF